MNYIINGVNNGSSIANFDPMEGVFSLLNSSENSTVAHIQSTQFVNNEPDSSMSTTFYLFLGIAIFQFLALIMFTGIAALVFRIVAGKDMGLVCMLLCLITNNVILLALMILITIYSVE